MATKLGIFNDALRLLGERSLVSLTENNTARRELDAAWGASSDLALKCLNDGFWKFASRVVQLPYDQSNPPQFGYTRSFAKPDDYVRTIRFCWDERLQIPLTDYTEVGTHWYAEPDEVYIQYVSKDSQRGLNLGMWPPKFEEYVAARLAHEAGPRITESNTKMERIEREMRQRLLQARSIDAMEGPTKTLPDGAWIRSRWGSGMSNRRHTGFLG